jgi:hypothetical protein
MLEIVRTDHAAAVVGVEPVGDLLGIAGFVQPRLVKADRTGADRAGAGLRHQRDHAGGIDPARKECAQRHIGYHARGYRLAQQMDQLGLKISGLARQAIGK